MAAQTNTTPIVRMVGIEKHFDGVRALNGLSLDLYPGEVHCIVGENGAGKSTLIKVLTGAHQPNEGQIYIDDTEYTMMTASLSKKLGIGVVYQENLFVPWMNAVENIFVGQEISNYSFIRFSDEYRYAAELIESLGLSLKLNQMVANMSVSDQQFLKIIKAISQKPRILIMDEPTSMFNAKDAEKVLNLVRRISSQGVGVIYISHFLKEVRQIADRITVIRDGKSINVYDNSSRNTDLDRVVSDMVGRSASLFYEKEQYDTGNLALEIDELKVGPTAEPISFQVKRGEILGVAGMVGAGRTEIANAIFGATRKYGGRVLYNGREITIKSPRDSIRHRMAYITEDRQRLGLNMEASIVENLTEVGMQTTLPGFFLRIKKLVPLIRNVVDELKIKISSPMMAAKNLSGGNQQKVVLGKWLFTDSEIFIFDEPTRGIDVNSKAEFYRIMTGLAKQGKIILMISSDMPELVSISDRVMVISKGKVVKILEKDEISENSIIRYALEVHTA